MQTSFPLTPTVPLVARSHNVTPPPEGLTHLDVLCGRQSFVLRHEGNKAYSKIVQSYAAQYKMCSNKRSKAKITALVIDKIHRRGGRFLKMTDDGAWVELDKQSILEKVQHALRSTKLKSSTGRAKPSRGTARAIIVEPSQEEDRFFKEILAKQQELYLESLATTSRTSPSLQLTSQAEPLPSFPDRTQSQLIPAF